MARRVVLGRTLPRSSSPAAGYRAIALSLRGHGGSPTAKPLSKCSIADYVEDVHSVADGLPAHAGGDRPLDGRLRRARSASMTAAPRPQC